MHRPVLDLRELRFIIPAILFLATDPNVRSLAINIISQMIYDEIKHLLKRDRKRTTVELEFVKVLEDGTLTSVKYRGSADEFDVISKKLKSLSE